VLEVFYDKTDDTPFLRENYECDPFVLDLINHKRAHLPYLHTVTIHSTEKVRDSETGEELPVGFLTLPSLEREAESAGIKLKIWLGYQDAPTMRRLTFPSPWNSVKPNSLCNEVMVRCVHISQCIPSSDL
jgi:hypothetical protein